MRGQRNVHVVKHASVYHSILPAAAFLGWSAQDQETAWKVSHSCLNSETRAEVGYRDEVVSASVADLRQGVVLCQQSHRRAVTASALQRPTERSFHAANTTLDLKSVLFERVGQQLGGVMLLEVKLRVRVDVEADVHQLLAVGVDGLCHGLKVLGFSHCHVTSRA